MMTEKVNDVQMRKSEVYSDVTGEAHTHDSEIWKTIPGYGDCYEVSSHGRVRSIGRVIDVFNVATGKTHQHPYRGQYRATSKEKNGLVRIRLNFEGKRYQRNLARLVAQAFVDGEQPGYSVGYLDGDRSNCNSSNLYWYNRKGNPLFGKAMAAGNQPVLLIKEADLPTKSGANQDA